MVHPGGPAAGRRDLRRRLLRGRAGSGCRRSDHRPGAEQRLPGTLVVSWDTPSPAPTDYRVDWAKSGESYRSYKVDEGHVYPEGSVTTVTITDLEAGTEYKVRMRARYNQGEHADSPWSGPWQEASLTVAAEPTPEPTAEPAPEPTAEPTEEPEDPAP